MKPLRYFAVSLFPLLCIPACSDEETPHSHPEVRSSAVCDDGVPAFDIYVDRGLTAVGPSPNELVDDGDFLWIVESANNTVSRFDMADESYEPGFVDVGNDRNPYAAAFDESNSELWIANYLSETVTVAHTDTGEVLAEVADDSLANPSAVALSEDYAYVANVDFRSTDEGYGPGTISVIDRATRQVVGELESAFPNPHFLAIEELDESTVLMVSAAGALEFDSQGVRTTTEGGLQWFEIGTDPVDPPTTSHPIGQQDAGASGAPARPLLTPDGTRIYFASAVAPQLFIFDVHQRQWLYDAADPLQLYDAPGDTTHRAAMGPNGLLWITAFNDDVLYLFDTACDELITGPIDLGTVANMLEGPQAIAVDETGLQAHYLLAIANELGKIRLLP